MFVSHSRPSPCLIVLGDPGSGKTTLSKWLAWRLSVGLVEPLPEWLAGRVAIPCILRELPLPAFDDGVSVADLAEIVATRLLGNKAEPATIAAVRARVEAKQYLLILDGIDEVPLARRPAIAAWIEQAERDGARCLATGRIVGYNDFPVDHPYTLEQAVKASAQAENFDLAMRAPVAREDDSDSRVHHWAQIRYLMPFDRKRVFMFVENWYMQRSASEQESKQRARDFWNVLEKSGVMQELARTPNLLSLMCIVFRERAHLPDGKALLYKEISNAYINTIDQHRKIAVDDAIAPYTWEAREGWLAYVGFKMQLERANAAKASSEKQSDSGVLARQDDVLAWLAEAMTASGVANANDRAKDFLGWVARRSGLLLPRGQGLFAFVHLSFQEYFCARYLANRVISPPFIKDRLGEDAPVTKKKLYTWANDATWRECLVYLMELIAGERDREWVEDLLEIFFDPTDDPLPTQQAILCARLLSDQHVAVTESSRDRLGGRCAQMASVALISLEPDDDLNMVPSVMIASRQAVVYASNLRASTYERINCSVLDPDAIRADPANSESVRLVVVADRAFTDINALRRFVNLRSLHIQATNIADISSLAALTSLEWLDIAYTKVTDIGPLAGLNNLRCLGMAGVGVVDISALATLPKLLVLDLRGTSISDLTPLTGLTSLIHLYLDSDFPGDLSALRGRASLTIDQSWGPR